MSTLIRNGQHMRPMLAVVKRYGIGRPDKYDRGVWIEKSDIPVIEKKMSEDQSAICVDGMVFVKGSNIHNYVGMRDFTELFST